MMGPPVEYSTVNPREDPRVSGWGVCSGSGLIRAVFAPMALLAHPAVRKLCLAAVVLNIVLPFGTHIGERTEEAEFGAMEGFSIALTTLALCALYIPFLAQGRIQRAFMPPARGATVFAAYVLFAAMSLFAATDPELAAYEVCLLAELLLLYIVLVKTVDTEAELLFLARILMMAVALESVLTIALRAGVIGDFNFLGVASRVDENPAIDFIRVGGTVGSPNSLAAVLSMGVVLAAAVAVTPLKRSDRVLAAATVVAGTVALVLTFSRGGMGTLVLGLTVVGAAGWWRGLISWKAPAFVAVLALAIGLSMADTLPRRFVEDDNGSAQSRVPLMTLASRMIADHPVFGVGANNFGVAMQPYLAPEFTGEFLYAVHNRYLLVWSETGIGALVAFVWFFVAALFRSLRCWRMNDPVLSTLAIGCGAALAGNMVHMSVDVFRGRPVTQLEILLAAILVVTEHLVLMRQYQRAGHRPWSLWPRRY